MKKLYAKVVLALSTAFGSAVAFAQATTPIPATVPEEITVHTDASIVIIAALGVIMLGVLAVIQGVRWARGGLA